MTKKHCIGGGPFFLTWDHLKGSVLREEPSTQTCASHPCLARRMLHHWQVNLLQNNLNREIINTI